MEQVEEMELAGEECLGRNMCEVGESMRYICRYAMKSSMKSGVERS